MAQLEQRTMYLFRSQPWADTLLALRGLLSARAALEQKKISNITPLLNRLELINKTALAAEGEIGTLRLIERELIRFLDTANVDFFLSNPDNKKFHDELAGEVMFIAAATGNDPGLWPVAPYTNEELNQVFAGNVSFYDETVFLHTLRNVLTTPGSRALAELFFYALPAAHGEPNAVEFRWWDDAFVFSSLLQVAWYLFPFLDFAEQQFLLQNYFYQAGVLGVPVRNHLAEVLKVLRVDRRDAMSDFYFEAVMGSKENVPIDFETWQQQPLAGLIKKYLALSYSQESGLLEQEKFITDLYQGQAIAAAMGGWLREALAIVWHLKRRDLVA